MITLGINAAYHDSAAALVADGMVLAAAEEERFTRIKHGKRPVPFSAWELPYHAIDHCLAQAGLTLGEVDHVAYSYDPREFLGQRLVLSHAADPGVPQKADWDSPWDSLFATYVSHAPSQLADGAPHHLRRRLSGVSVSDPPYRWHFLQHHLCHQASAFLASPFKHCAVMTLDGRGERATTTYGCYRDDGYEPLGEVHMPHSLGLLYERVTSHLGFLHSSDEYKVMALAAMGTHRFRKTLLEHVQLGEQGQYTVAPMDLSALFGPPRLAGQSLSEQHLDLAASLQDVLEEVVLHLAAWLGQRSGERQLAMAGGVALNCVMNSRLRDSGLFDDVWVQPAAGDAGTALGAALWVDSRMRLKQAESAGRPSGATTAMADTEGGPPLPPRALRLAPRRWQMDNAYLGPAYGDAEIERLLRWAKLRHRKLANPARETASLLAQGAMIGWFQGRMEFGPRALGARSILASPVDPSMQARLNELKDREDFRPFAPAVMESVLADWFSPSGPEAASSPFMLFLYDVLPHRRSRIASACHTDGTARVQTVSHRDNPLFHTLLAEFNSLTGVPILINTSFNVRGEPIVCTPRAAIDAFFSTPLDALVIGNCLVEKGA